MKFQILKTGLLFFALNLISVFTTTAQVGIGTTNPKSSLQVEGKPSDTTTPDGVQVPSLTITQLEGKIIGGAYGADQDGAIVYISDASIVSSIPETADIKNKGFYYYFHNGVSGTWRVIGEQKIDLTNPDRVPRWDGTNLIEGSIIDAGGNVGIGTLTPDALLDVEGSFQFKDGSEGNTKLLTSDSDGNATWQSIKLENFLGTGNAPQPDFNCLSTVGSLGTGGARSVAVSGNYAYVLGDLSDELIIIDVSNQASPILSGALEIGSDPRSVAVSGNYAYVVDNASDDLKIINVSNPANPILSGLIGIGSNPWSVAVSGNYAYVVDIGSDDLKIINVSNPASPILSGFINIGSNPRSVAVSGNYAYVVDISSGDLKVIDVSTPSSPVLSGSLGIGAIPLSVAVSGNYAYVVDEGSDDLKVIDVSNPANPILSGSIGIGSVPSSIAISGNYAYVVDFDSDDLKVIDVSNPANPILSGSLGIGPVPLSVAVFGNYAYVVDLSSSDLKIIELSCSPSLAINPLSGHFETVTESDPKVATTIVNAIPKWDGSNLINGTIVDSGGNVGIGVNIPEEKLHVEGTIEVNQKIQAHDSGGLELATDDEITRISILDNGNVGIGITNPNFQLHSLVSASVTSTFNDKIALYMDNSNTNGSISNPNEVGLAFGRNGIIQQAILGGTFGNDWLKFYVADLATPKMTMRFNGNVGIGTENPQERLQVQGNIEIDQKIIAHDNGGLEFATDEGTTRLRVYDNGKIVIGTNPTAPQSPLSVSSTIANFNGGLQLNDGSGNDWYIYQNALKGLSFADEGIDKMTIDNFGNIGIGTNSPEAKLHVEGTIEVDQKIQANDSGGLELATSNGITQLKINNNGSMSLNPDSSSSNTVDVHVSQFGYLGIGTTSPDALIHINPPSTPSLLPAILIDGGSEDISVPDGQALQFGHWSGSSFIERIRMNSSGNVGIGTSSISQKLVVNGNALKTSGGGSWLTTSDFRLKKDITPYTNGLYDILKIRPVRFKYNKLSGQNTENENVGVIAQELKEVAPDMVSTFMLNDKEYYNVDNSAMTYMLINAIKELKAENDELKKKLEKLDQLEAMLIELKADLNVNNNNNSENVVQK